MIWKIFWIVGLIEFSRVAYLTLASFSLNQLPQPVIMTRRRLLFRPFFGGVISAVCFGLTVNSTYANSTLSHIAVVIGVPILLISYWAIRRERVSIGAYTPYELEEKFDLFISYRRTLHAERVRRIVEALVSKGVRVWFDDYAMFATNIQRKTDIKKSIRTGIKNSKHALVFESKGYNKSKWCRHERIVLKSCLSTSLDDIQIHPQPETDESERAEVDVLLKELDPCSSGERPQVADSFVGKTNFFRDEGAGYQFDAGNWVIAHQGGYFFLRDQYMGPSLTHHNDPYWLNLNVIIGPSATYQGNLLSSWHHGDKHAIMHRAFDDLFSKDTPDPEVDEKSLWHAGDHFARNYEKMRGVAVRGSHIFILGKDYHYAVTYWDKRGWVRRYSIVAIDPVTWIRLEIAIAFKFFGPFVELCAHAYQMDALVQSFRPLSVD